MKVVSSEYKETLLKNGRILDAKITFGGATITSGDINQIVPATNGDILKSVMKSVEIDSNIQNHYLHINRTLH